MDPVFEKLYFGGFFLKNPLCGGFFFISSKIIWKLIYQILTVECMLKSGRLFADRVVEIDNVAVETLIKVKDGENVDDYTQAFLLQPMRLGSPTT